MKKLMLALVATVIMSFAACGGVANNAQATASDSIADSTIVVDSIQSDSDSIVNLADTICKD